MKTRLYRDLAGLTLAAGVALASLAPRAALADDREPQSRTDETRVALKQTDRTASSLDNDPFMHEESYQPAFITMDRDAEPPTATTSYVLFGVSGAAAATAIVFGVLKAKASADVDELCDGSVCLDSAQDALEREDRYALATDISAGIAIAGAGAGLYYWVKARREKKRWLAGKNSLQPTVVPGGVGVSFAGSF